ncbi:hypothetical protein JHK82_031754 [Glycine max]|nr:hypothetical protein JHK82_031754 [Glycine max]
MSYLNLAFLIGLVVGIECTLFGEYVDKLSASLLLEKQALHELEPLRPRMSKLEYWLLRRVQDYEGGVKYRDERLEIGVRDMDQTVGPASELTFKLWETSNSNLQSRIAMVATTADTAFKSNSDIVVQSAFIAVSLQSLDSTHTSLLTADNNTAHSPNTIDLSSSYTSYFSLSPLDL